ncbi:unnamed protein product [Rhodiola kirilowii]
MAILPLEGCSESPADSYPLLMERMENISNGEHVIDITRGTDTAVPGSARDGDSDPPVGLPSSALMATESLPSVPTAYVPSSNNSSTVRRGDNRRRSPLNSGLWICIELFLTISQIVASIVVLALSKHEQPHAPLRVWIMGYAFGCVAVLPLLFWRYFHRNQSLEQETGLNREISVQGTLSSGTRLSLSFTRSLVEDGRQTIPTTVNAVSGSHQYFGRLSNSQLKTIVDYFKIGLDCFFAIWFVVGNVWIFGGNSASEAPNLYRLCAVFLAFSCFGYAMPFILCATLCCCLPCIISILGFREDLNQTRGATSKSINALPTYKFKIKKNRSGSNRDASSVVEEGGVVAAGTDKERVISAEDAACCICLAKYVNNDELRELPCYHFLHKDCLDKWLKINATCPLCKCEVGASVSNSPGTSGD